MQKVLLLINSFTSIAIVMTKRTPISDYVTERGQQTRLAKQIGVTQGAIYQMLKSGRDIFVLEHADGSVELEEVKKISGVA